MNNLSKKIFSLFLFFILLSSGCASLHEKGKRIWGSSVEHLENARQDGKSSDIALSLDNCFTRTEKIFKDLGATVYPIDKDKKYLAAMNFKGHVNTTQVGIFFTKKNERLTHVEVASMSPALCDEIATLLFEELKK